MDKSDLNKHAFQNLTVQIYILYSKTQKTHDFSQGDEWAGVFWVFGTKQLCCLYRKADAFLVSQKSGINESAVQIPAFPKKCFVFLGSQKLCFCGYAWGRHFPRFLLISQMFLSERDYYNFMDTKEFLELCKIKDYVEKDLKQFEKAMELARTFLSQKWRLSGDIFFDHNLRVAVILVQNRADSGVIIAGLLQGILKYVKEEGIEEKFSREVVELLQGFQELKELKFKNTNLEAEALRKIILTTLKDMRIVLIKLASKLDNLQSISALPEKDQKRIAQEVLDVYAPLAYRLGMEKIKIQLENHAFKIINLKKYQEISNFLEESREEQEHHVESAINSIKEICKGEVKIIKIKGRPKHIYSIYKKIINTKINLKDLFDLLGIRIIVPEIKDCYTVLGLLHQNFDPVEGRLKDYIANPKLNFYRSIHTGLKLPNGKIVEVQIRTEEMNEFAEEGVAAHWQYKGLKSDQKFEKKMSWLRGVLDLQNDQKDQKEFLETIKVDVFGDKMFCYTPKGDVKELPKGAKLLDFAYLVHEHVGNKSVGGRVNGKFVPLKHALNAGDVVEIITNKNQRPRRNWLKIVYSAKTRQKIRRFLKEHDNLAPTHFNLLKPAAKEEQGLLVGSEEFPNAICNLAKCCSPIPDEEIAGIITKRKIISVHKEDCRLALKEENRWVPVQWKNTFNQKIRFFVDAKERSGLLADLLHTIVSTGFEIKEAKAKLRGLNVAVCSFLVIPRDLDHLKKLIARVGKINGVYRIYFE